MSPGSQMIMLEEVLSFFKVQKNFWFASPPHPLLKTTFQAAFSFTSHSAAERYHTQSPKCLQVSDAECLDRADFSLFAELHLVSKVRMPLWKGLLSTQEMASDPRSPLGPGLPSCIKPGKSGGLGLSFVKPPLPSDVLYHSPLVLTFERRILFPRRLWVILFSETMVLSVLLDCNCLLLVLISVLLD